LPGAAPPASGPASKSVTRALGTSIARGQHGGGPDLNLKFPENREFNREFFEFSADSALLGADSRSDFNALQPNSLLTARAEIASQFQCVAREFPVLERTGNFFAGTGNFSGGTGNSFSLRGFTGNDRQVDHPVFRGLAYRGPGCMGAGQRRGLPLLRRQPKPARQS
jgi:hypothetical protein